MAFNNVGPKDWYFVYDYVCFRKGLRLKVIGVDKPLHDHVELPHVLDLAVHLVFSSWLDGSRESF